MRKHSEHEYQVIVLQDKYSYFILDPKIKGKIKLQSHEWFDTEVQAGFAAIGHITLLEQGE